MLRPLHDYILIKVSRELPKVGNLQLLSNYECSLYATVIAKSKGYWVSKTKFKEIDVDVGDTIIFPKGAGIKNIDSDPTIIMIKEQDINAVLPKE